MIKIDAETHKELVAIKKEVKELRAGQDAMIQHDRPKYVEQLDSAIYSERVAAVLLAADGFRNRKEIQDVTGIPQMTCWRMIDRLVSKDIIFSLEESKNGSPIYEQARWFKKLRLEDHVQSKFTTNSAKKSQNEDSNITTDPTQNENQSV